MTGNRAELYVKAECPKCDVTSMMEAEIVLYMGGATLQAYCPECDYVYKNSDFLCEF